MERINKLEQLARLLESSMNQRREAREKADAYIDDFLQNLPQMHGYSTGRLEKLESFQIEEGGKSIDSILDVLASEVDRIGINPASGRHLGYIPGGGLWASSIGDQLAAITNRYAGIAFSSPGAVKIEDHVIKWMVSVIGYPDNAYGNLTSGGSTANLIAIKAARDHRKINSGNITKAVIYMTEQVHHCVHKAIHTTGLHEAELHLIPMNGKFQMDADELETQVLEDDSNGLAPFLVIASAGTTDTGAIDPLDRIGSVCEKLKIWFHVDVAYGGFFMLVDSMKKKLKGIERSDSIVLDPHKTMFIPFGSGAVLLRDRNILLASNSYRANYMKDTFDVEEINPADTGIELSRHNRSLRMWLPLQLYGIGPLRAALEEKLLLCEYFDKQIRRLGFETAVSPELSISVFRWPADKDNSVNQRLIALVHSNGRVFLSSTVIDGRLWLRCAIICHRTHRFEIDLALQMISEKIDEALSSQPSPYE